MTRCPNGHDSTSDDFCSVCGAEVAPPVAAPNTAVPEQCPVCGTARESSAQVFCETCGIDLRTAGPTHAAPQKVPSGGVGGGAEVRWELVVTVDPKLHGRVNPDAPTGEPERRFTLFDTESVIGRLDAGVRVHIPIRNDPGVSRRHAVLMRCADGTVSAHDLGSANGITVNGVELPSGAERALKDGDVLGVGGWTRIVLRACR
jgi:hypothetical protein